MSPISAWMARRRHRSCDGSALLLVPVGVLVMALLLSFAVDSTAAFLAQREAHAAASSLANDLVSLAVDERALRRYGSYRISQAQLRRLQPLAQRITAERLSAVFEPGSAAVRVTAASAMSVQVSVEGDARRVIGLIGNISGRSAIPVRASAVARAHLSG